MAEKSHLLLLLALFFTACGSPESGSYEQALGKRFVPTDGSNIDVIDSGTTGGGSGGSGGTGGSGGSGGGSSIPAPLAPISVSVVNVGSNVQLTIQPANDMNEQGYYIYRHNVDVPASKDLIGSMTSQSSTFYFSEDLVDAGQSLGTYTYIVRAWNTTGAAESTSNSIYYDPNI